MLSKEVVFVTPDCALGRRLLPVARRIFTDTFSRLYDRADFEAFCDAVYKPGGSMDGDLEAPDVNWQVATYKDEPIGYAKVTPLRAPAVTAAAGSLELQQIYVASAWHGTGVADNLMAWALTTANARRALELYLTVFDHNERAKRFYRRHGFEEVGRCDFKLGERIDDDRIWRRMLNDH
jgi:ribosomal protein S18 acetylase RimI-like enzyme